MTADRAGRRRLEGIGGWLLLFTIAQTIGFFYALYSASEVQQLREQLEGPLADPSLGFGTTLVVELVLHVARAIVLPVGLFLILTRRPSAPRYWSLVLLATMLGFALDLVLGLRLLGQLRPLLAPEALAEVSREVYAETARTAGGILGTFLWLLYWRSSQRVANTFAAGDGAEAFAEAAFVPGTGIPEVYDPPPSEEVETVREPSFGNRPTRSCPACGTVNLVAAIYCRGCRGELAAAPGGG